MTRLAEGFPIEDPQVVVPWGVTEADLLALLPVRPRHVTAGYLTLEVVSLCGMRHTLGFHFQPRNQGRLAELEFFSLSVRELGGLLRRVGRALGADLRSPARASAG